MFNSLNSRRLHPIARATAAAFVLMTGVWTSASAAPNALSDAVAQQISDFQAEKASRTPAQQKMDSHLVLATKRMKKVAFSQRIAPIVEKAVKLEDDGAALVDITAPVTEDLLKELSAVGATRISSVPRFDSIRARVPVAALEKLAGRTDVRFIKRAVRAMTHTGAITSEGDVAHGTNGARTTFSVSGAGVKVGILSDSVDYLAGSQAGGELGPVTVLEDTPGQSGEGTAMLEIVHDLAPQAQLYFATAYTSEAGFAQNILNLRAAGCDIIADDIFYFDESPFQDGPIAQAIEQATADGAIVFSAAGNEGSKDKGTSGTWEGDYVDGGATAAPITKAGRLHNFGGQNYDVITEVGFGQSLFWSDPLGGSTNDYDLYVLSADGTTVVAFSNTTQNGTQDPFEFVAPDDVTAGMRLVVVKAAAAANRFLQVATIRGILSISTNGKVSGHSATRSVLSTAAVSAAGGAVFSASSPVEAFSSDGPRRIFYNGDGTAITPGNFSSTGGRVLQKPDIAAADGVTTSVPGFAPFYGTSAAAPHAAAIAALLKSQNLAMTPQQLRAAVLANVIDIEAPGWDRDSGLGILRPGPTLATIPEAAKVEAAGLTITGESATPANGMMDPGERITVSLALRNTGGGATNALTATLLEADGVTQPTAAQIYGALPAHSSTGTARTFSFNANGPAGGKVKLTFLIADGPVNYATYAQTFTLGTLGTTSAFANAATITITDRSATASVPQIASPYPSRITVSGLTGVVGKVTARLNGFSHTYPEDIDVMLVGPSGRKVMLMSDAGGGTPASNTNLTFDDAGTTLTPSVSGTYHPLDLDNGVADVFPAPVPAGAYTSEMASFVGDNPNGVWSLYIVDEFSGDAGFVSGGWTLSITPATYTGAGNTAADLAVSMSASSGSAAVGQQITYTITVFNDGSVAATGVTLSDVLPAGTMSFGSATSSQGTVAHSGNSVTANLGTIPGQGRAVVTIVANAAAAGAFTNSATATTSTTEVSSANNSASSSGSVGLPNLLPVQPSGWSDKIVVSTLAGATTDGVIARDAPLLVDIALANAGSAPAPAYFSTQLFVDGSLFRTIERQLAVPVNGIYQIQDLPVPALGAGVHTLRVVVDSGAQVTESNETDNQYSRTLVFGTPPTITPLAPAKTLEDAVFTTPFTINDLQTAASSLALTATSSNTAVVPGAGISFTGAEGARTLRVQPAPDASGSTTITITVTDGDGRSATSALDLTVLPVNDAPTLGPFSTPIVINEDAAPQTVPLTGIGSGAANETGQALTVTARSDNPALVPDPAVTYGGSGTTGSLSFQPVADRSGTATITVTVTDDGGVENGGVDTATESFTVQVLPVNDPPTFGSSGDVSVNEDAGPQTRVGWAAKVSSGPDDEAGQTVQFLVETDNAELFSSAPAIAPDGTLTFTPAPEAFGRAVVKVTMRDSGGTANGGNDASPPVTFSITVAEVNDAPAFTKGANQQVKQNAGPQNVAWASGITAGPVNESEQALDFVVSTDNASLFAVQPTVSADGHLLFTPSPSISGVANVTVVLHDSGGTANGGSDSSPPQSFAIVTTPVNDVPFFVKGPDLETAQDDGPQTVPSWATAILPGPVDEAGQRVDFQVTTSDAGLFASQPAISPDGTLTYTPAPKGSGTATITVRLHDDGGTAEGGVDTSAPQSFTIAVTTFKEESGFYHGLVSAAPGVNATHENSGLVRIDVLKTGAFTGRLILGGKPHILRGRFDKSGVATFGPRGREGVERIVRGMDGEEVSLSLKLDVSRGSNELSGVIKQLGQDFARIRADRGLYSKFHYRRPDHLQVPEELLGRYTVLFVPPAPAENGLAASAYPQGAGVGLLRFSKTGVAHFVGTLADGTHVSYSMEVSKNNVWPLYISLQHGHGSLSGPVSFRDQPGVSDFDASGVHWFKPPSHSRYYSAGWMNGITLDVLGSKYDSPDHRSEAVFKNLPVPDSNGNLLVQFTGGGLPPEFEKAVNVTGRRKAEVIERASDRLSLSISRRTGNVYGRFHVPGAKREGIHAVIFQKQGIGSGFFLGPSEAGSISLTPDLPKMGE